MDGEGGGAAAQQNGMGRIILSFARVAPWPGSLRNTFNSLRFGEELYPSPSPSGLLLEGSSTLSRYVPLAPQKHVLRHSVFPTAKDRLNSTSPKSKVVCFLIPHPDAIIQCAR